ncbi:DUF4421 domain-containing protein [Taibaiella soli]|uniref:DUF4421 domain-containing protein n=1 Tax=Taibaiella soli TaxID=1649169 RepID=A0A2W2AC57_9BACT|nr:DUF4421 domain-containing protein [Taibaiella soli]PZF71202.1 hypothetical protein DN068_19710 [Taibaiella soli]
MAVSLSTIKRLLTTTLCCGFFIAASAQDSVKITKGTAWVRPMDDYLTAKVTQITDLTSFAVYTNTNKIVLQQNGESATMLNLNYSFISAFYIFVPKFIPGNNDNDTKGKTSSQEFGFNFNFAHWQQSLSYERVKGFYLENTADYRPGWKDGDPYVQFPGLIYKCFEGVTAYNFNRKYSVNAVVTQSEQQLKSAGSFIPSLRYRYYIINNPPDSIYSTQKSNNIEVILNAGYYYTLVLPKHFYISAGIAAGGGFIETKLTTRVPGDDDVISHQTNAIFRLDGQLGLGYNGNRFFGGIYSFAFSDSYKQQNTTVVTGDSKLNFQFFIGYRFNAPKFLKKQLAQMNEMIEAKRQQLKSKQ